MRIQSTPQYNYQNRNIGFKQNYLAKFVGAPCVEYSHICRGNKSAVLSQVLTEARDKSGQIQFALEAQHQGKAVLIAVDSPTLELWGKKKTDADKNVYLSQVAASAEELIVSLLDVCQNCARRVRS